MPKKISELPIANDFNGSEFFPIIQDGENKKAESKKWILPLYLVGDAESSESFRLDDIDGFGAIIYEDNERVSAVYPDGFYSSNNSYEAILNTSWNNGNPDTAMLIIKQFPLGIVSVSLSENRFQTSTHLGVAIDVDASNSLKLGFFGEKTTQKQISETSADPAIAELQDILIAFGLATDNRS